jgi:hypothetical protein
MKNPRDPSQQARWRQTVLNAYGSEHKKGKLGWCPISGVWVEKQYLTTAHIVRYNVTELAAEHLFGSADKSGGHIWSIYNGIPMLQAYEAMIDDAKIAIIPTKDGKDLMVTVLDRNELDNDEEETLYPMRRKLDGRILEFKTDHRPAMRYLYFNFAMSILRRQRYAVDGWWKDRVQYDNTPFFATPGKWVRETTLRKLAIRVGHLPEDEAKSFVAMTQGSVYDDLSLEEDVGAGEDKKKEKEEVHTSSLQYAYQDITHADMM